MAPPLTHTLPENAYPATPKVVQLRVRAAIWTLSACCTLAVSLLAIIAMMSRALQVA